MPAHDPRTTLPAPPPDRTAPHATLRAHACTQATAHARDVAELAALEPGLAPHARGHGGAMSERATVYAADVLAGRARWSLECANAAAFLAALPDACCDALVTDPPAGIGFMGLPFDSDHGGRTQWVAHHAAIFAQCRRVLAPGAHAVVWALPRTAHWTATAMEDAGFEIRDVIVSLNGQGFPKSRSLLKPAGEHWILARAPGPLRELNIDACRIGTSKEVPASLAKGDSLASYGVRPGRGGASTDHGGHDPSLGRWPANVVLEHAENCARVGTKRVRGAGAHDRRGAAHGPLAAFGAEAAKLTHGHGDDDGTEAVEDWRCAEGCPVAMLDAQSGTTTSPGSVTPAVRGIGYTGRTTGAVFAPRPTERGGASRFFFCAKARPAQKSRGLDARNPHPTVKPIDLMRWLVRLVAPMDVASVGCPRCHAEQAAAPSEKRLIDETRTQLPSVPGGVPSEGREVGLLLGDVSCGEPAKAAAPVPSVRGVVQGPRGSLRSPSQILLAGLRERRSEDDCSPRLPGLPGEVPADQQRDPGVVLEEVRGDGERADPPEARRAAGPEGLRADAGADSPDGQPRGLRDGTPARDGELPPAGPRSVGGRPPHQRRQRRQPDREPRAAHEVGTRPHEEAAAKADHVPALQRDDHRLGTCTTCGAGLIEVRRAAIILDPFAGSGSTLIAALYEGRRAIGCEREAAYAAIARARIGDAAGPLFAAGGGA